MTQNSPTPESERIDAEIALLKAQLADYEERIHGQLKKEPNPNWNRIRGIENRIREIVLRLVELEREQIEARIASDR
jgi:hypothetical protein